MSAILAAELAGAIGGVYDSDWQYWAGMPVAGCWVPGAGIRTGVWGEGQRGTSCACAARQNSARGASTHRGRGKSAAPSAGQNGADTPPASFISRHRWLTRSPVSELGEHFRPQPLGIAIAPSGYSRHWTLRLPRPFTNPCSRNLKKNNTNNKTKEEVVTAWNVPSRGSCGEMR